MAISRTYDSVFKEIGEIHAKKHRRTHPLWVALMQGELSKPQVREYIKQFGVVPLYNHFYHGPLYMSCPDPEWRPRMAEVVYEEGTGRIFSDGIPHWKLYLNLGEAFGISKEEMYGAQLCAGSLALRSYMTEVCHRGFLEGIAATSLGGEAQVVGVAGKVSQAMMKYYGCTPEQAAFYTVHEEADKDHSDAGIDFLKQFATTDADIEMVLRTVRNTVEVWWAFYDDMWRVVKAVH